ncbi:MAG: hypothetical protein HY606_00200 [Planctomycetes bacterium]|nr:hypothetical protein [Planctomycetota bacterium]
MEKLEQLESKIFWEEKYDTALTLGKELTKPLVVLTYADDKASTKFVDLAENKGAFKEYASDYIWYKEEKYDSKPSLAIIDPYTDEKQSTDISNTGTVAGKLKSFSKDFSKKYNANNKYLCAKCSKVKNGKGKCCKQETQKIVTFKCATCGKASSEEKKCCSQDMKPVTEEGLSL